MLISNTEELFKYLHIRVILSLRILENILMAFREREMAKEHPTVTLSMDHSYHDSSFAETAGRGGGGGGLVETRSNKFPSSLMPDETAALPN